MCDGKAGLNSQSSVAKNLKAGAEAIDGALIVRTKNYKKVNFVGGHLWKNRTHTKNERRRPTSGGGLHAGGIERAAGAADNDSLHETGRISFALLRHQVWIFPRLSRADMRSQTFNSRRPQPTGDS
jgi:hypothetical protein